MTRDDRCQVATFVDYVFIPALMVIVIVAWWFGYCWGRMPDTAVDRPRSAPARKPVPDYPNRLTLKKCANLYNFKDDMVVAALFPDEDPTRGHRDINIAVPVDENTEVKVLSCVNRDGVAQGFVLKPIGYGVEVTSGTLKYGRGWVKEYDTFSE